MKNFFSLLVVFVLTFAVCTAASAQITFKDVPDDHWAAPSVYELVKLGVTKGYPDGTFRGTKQITRYETAVFLAKLAKAIGTDVKADVSALQEEVAALKKGSALGFSGSYMADWKFGNLLAEAGSVRGAVASYRLKLASTHDLGEGASIKIGLDTMDYGYYNDGLGSFSTDSDLATQLLDVEGKLKLNLAGLGLADPVDLKVTVGPGNKQHGQDNTGNVIPSDVGVTYMRPDTGVTASTTLWGADVSGGYNALSHATSGKIDTSQLSGQVGYAFEGVPLVNELEIVTTGQYVSAGQFSSETRDVRGSIALAAPMGEKVEAGTTIGLGGSERKNWMVSGTLALNDLWDTGTVAVIRAAKVGSEFIDSRFASEEFDFAGFDSFDRPLGNGTVNIGGEIVQNVSEDVRLVGKGDIRLNGDYKYESPNGRLTAQGGVSYAVAPNTTLDAMYRINQDKSTDDTTDLTAFGLMYSF